ncbi:MAG: cupin domain-containing protein [Acidobacteriota bacterium]|nr:cupin domain-containing protein [Acidobacteriota bacterium]
MENVSRRDVLVALSAFAAMGCVQAEGQASPVPSMPGENVLSQSKVFPFDSLPVNKNANGASRAVVRGALATGESVEMHETTLLPGHMPHPPHKHRHSEFMMIREGELEFDNDGTKERVGPGGVIFAASDVTHGLINVGSVPANYFVIAIGKESGITRVGGVVK